MIGRYVEGNMNEDRFRFRVWGISHKKWENKKIVEDARIGFLPKVSSNYVVEQCTGLKDKNGRLIYEGDIVKAFVKDYCFVGYISWDLDRWEIKDVSIPVFFDLYDAFCDENTGHDKNTIEIIGNIHENKELLKGE